MKPVGSLAVLAVALTLSAACGKVGDHVTASKKTQPRQAAVAPAGDASAMPACTAETTKTYKGFTLTAAYDASVGTIRRWHFWGPNHPVPLTSPMPEPQYLQGRADSEMLHVCYLDGSWAVSLPPGTPLPDRGVVLVDGAGADWLLFAAGSAQTPLARPAANGA